MIRAPMKRWCIFTASIAVYEFKSCCCCSCVLVVVVVGGTHSKYLKIDYFTLKQKVAHYYQYQKILKQYIYGSANDQYALENQ